MKDPTFNRILKEKTLRYLDDIKHLMMLNNSHYQTLKTIHQGPISVELFKRAVFFQINIFDMRDDDVCRNYGFEFDGLKFKYFYMDAKFRTYLLENYIRLNNWLKRYKFNIDSFFTAVKIQMI